MSLLDYFQPNHEQKHDFASQERAISSECLDDLSSPEQSENEESSSEPEEIPTKKKRLHSYTNDEKSNVVAWLEKRPLKTAVDAAAEFKIVSQDKEFMIDTFRKTGLSLPIDGSRDHEMKFDDVENIEIPQ